MVKTGNIYRCVIFFLFLGMPAALFGQSGPSVEATVSQTTLHTGQRLKLSITVSGSFRKVNRPVLPDFKGFRLLNKTPSTSRSISYINGVSKSSYSYNYFLAPKGKGDYTIPAVTIKVDGKKYKTDPIHIHVTGGNKAPGNHSTQGDEESNIFLRLTVSNTHPVTGEQLIANITLYFKSGLQVQSYQPIPGWKAQGFWKESLDNNGHPTVQSTVINGVRYRKARLMQFALFPTKAGKLSISPYQVNIAVREAVQNDPFNSFFGGFGSRTQNIKLKTDPVSVTVDSLPKADTTRYIGAVGSFNISRKINTHNIKVGETIQLTTTINGSGNIPLINKPHYTFPHGLEVYQPQETSHINRKDHQISGSKTFTDVMIARSPGTFKIPAKTLSYFNPKRHKFIKKTLPAETITVSGSAATATTSNPSSFSLKPITGLVSWITPESKALYDNWWLWLGVLLPALVFGLAYWRRSYQYKMNTDHTFARSQKADRKAGERLDKALGDAENNQVKEAYSALQKAVEGFISDRLGLPEAGLSIEQYVAALEEHGVNAELTKNVRMLLNKCATINYAPDNSPDLLKSHVGLGESIIKKLKKEL
jgi:hypothetical protein